MITNINNTLIPVKLKAAAKDNSVTSCATEEKPVSRKLDISNIPFAISFEIAGSNNVSNVSRALKNTGWSVDAAGYDCSHWGDQSYTSVKTKEMTLANGGLDKIKTALNALKPLSLSVGDTGAMKIWVKRDFMDLSTYKNLFKIYLANEPLIYKLAQHGAPTHHGLRHHQTERNNYYFCVPLSRYLNKKMMDAETTDKLLNEMYFAYNIGHNSGYDAQHVGLNFSNSTKKGFLEFRYFDSTIDPVAAASSIELVMGGLKAAYEGRVPKEGVTRSLDAYSNRPYPLDDFNMFLEELTENSATREYLTKIYEKSGGKFDELNKVTFSRLETLIQNGYQFSTLKGTLDEDKKPFNLREALENKYSVIVKEPKNGNSYQLQANDLCKFISLSFGDEKALNNDEKVFLAITTKLLGHGVTFSVNGGSKSLQSNAAILFLASRGSLTAKFKKEPTAIINSVNDFLNYAYGVLKNDYPPEYQQGVERCMILKDRGYKFFGKDNQGKIELTDRMKVLRELEQGGLGFLLPGTNNIWSCSNTKETLDFVAAEAGYLSELPAEISESILLADELKNKGFILYSGTDGNIAYTKLAVPLLLSKGELCYQIPKGKGGLKFKGDFKQWGLAALGRIEELNKDNREMLLRVNKMKQEGANFTDEHGIAKTDCDILQAFEWNMPVCVNVSGERSSFNSKESFCEFLKEYADISESLSTGDRELLQWFTTQHIKDGMKIYSDSKDGKAELNNIAQVAWLLHGKKPLKVEANKWNSFQLNGLSDIKRAYNMEVYHPDQLSLEERQTVNVLSKLTSRGVKFYINQSAAKKVPIDMKWMQSELLKKNLLNLSLPTRIWWNFSPKKSIAVGNLDDLAFAAAKLIDKAN